MKQLKKLFISSAIFAPMLLSFVILPKYLTGHDLAVVVALLTILTVKLDDKFLKKK